MTKYIFDIETANQDPEGDKKDALNPFGGRIVAIGLLEVGKKEPLIFSKEDEAALLRDFWNILADGDTLIGFSNQYFDNRFVFIRSLINRIRPARVHSKDLRSTLAFGEGYRAKGTLHDFCSCCGLYSGCDDDSSQIPEWFHRGQIHKIEEHLKDDLYKTSELLKHIVKYTDLLGDFIKDDQSNV